MTNQMRILEAVSRCGRSSTLSPPWLIARVLCCLFAILCAGAASAQSFRVSQIRICTGDPKRSCNEQRPPFQNLDKRQFSNGRIYIALTIVCGSEALAFLAEKEYLPANAAIWRNGKRDDNDIFIGIDQGKWEEQGSRLTPLAEAQGEFPWTTHFNLRIDGIRTFDIQISSSRDAFVLMGTEPARLRLTFAN
jgi:hypothetical protein